jgi:hypothetical protein
MRNFYLNTYNILVNSRKVFKENWLVKGSGLERHHIIPKHIGGTNDETNYTYLTRREHIVAHFLLWKIHKNNGDRWAVCIMSGHKIDNVGEKHPCWGKPLSEEHKEKLRSRKRSAESKERYSKSKLGEKNSFFGKKHTAKNLVRMHPIVECPHCKKKGNKGNMIRWHFDNCAVK